MPHNSKSPSAKGQAIKAWAWPSVADQSPRQGPGISGRAHPPNPARTRSPRWAARPPSVVRTHARAREDPGGLGPGHASEAPKQRRALCSGRQGCESPRPSPQVPAAAHGFLWLPDPGSASAGGCGLSLGPSTCPPSLGEKLWRREKRPDLRGMQINHGVNRFR